MSTGRFEVEGKVFYNRTDYEAALRDLKKIEQIRLEYDLNDAEDIRSVYAHLASGSYRFESSLGDDFDDEIFTLYSKVKDKAQNVSQKKSKPAKQVKTNSKKQTMSFKDCDDELKAAVEEELHRQEKRRNLMILGFSVIALLCFVFFGLDRYNEYKAEEEATKLSEIKDKNKTPGTAHKPPESVINADENTEKKEPEVLEDYKTLLNMNKDLIGWLKIADINIDYPVMQSGDNEYYLRRDFDEEYDKNGCLFLDYQCDILSGNTNWIIYGHNMQSGKMFGQLDKYSDEEYYKAHPKFEFDTIYEKGVYEIVYVFRSKIYNEDAVVFKYYQFIDANSEVEFNSNMTEMEKLSLYDTGITPKYGDKLLTLSTCDYLENNGRFVIVARKIN